MRANIKFTNATSPIQNSNSASGPTWKEMTVKEKYRDRLLKFQAGDTWLRFLPRIDGSLYNWMMAIEVYSDICKTSILTPRTLDPQADDPFETARYWFLKNNKEALYNKDTNLHGLRFTPKKQTIAWAIHDLAEEGQRLKLFKASNYSGEFGGKPGLGFSLLSMTDEKDTESGSDTEGELIHGDIINPEDGRRVKITKIGGDGKDEYASYNCLIGKKAAPIEDYVKLLTDEETALVAPLENVLHQPSPDELQGLLRRYIGDEFYFRVFPRTISMGEPAPVTKASASMPTPKTTQPVVEEASAPAKAVAAPEVEDEIPGLENEPKVTMYSLREINALLEHKEGIPELVKNKARILPKFYEYVAETASEMGIDCYEAFGLAGK
jgi:hypothetical protein